MHKTIRIVFIISLFIHISPWIQGTGENTETEGTDVESKFDDFTKHAYIRLNCSDLSYDVFKYALKGYYNLNREGLIHNKDYITIIDYRMSCNEKRMFVIHTDSIKVVVNSLVAHGKNSGIMYPTSFSNSVHSNKSSLGFYITGNTYNGKHGYSLRLNGVDKAFNDNAGKRAVVIHGAKYVSDKNIVLYGRIGRSFGCPALPVENSKEIINLIKDKSCVFVYYPDEEYLSISEYLNNPDYLFYF